jgi:hypothetical protein
MHFARIRGAKTLFRPATDDAADDGPKVIPEDSAISQNLVVTRPFFLHNAGCFCASCSLYLSHRPVAPAKSIHEFTAPGPTATVSALSLLPGPGFIFRKSVLDIGQPVAAAVIGICLVRDVLLC